MRDANLRLGLYWRTIALLAVGLVIGLRLIVHIRWVFSFVHHFEREEKRRGRGGGGGGGWRVRWRGVGENEGGAKKGDGERVEEMQEKYRSLSLYALTLLLLLTIKEKPVPISHASQGNLMPRGTPGPGKEVNVASSQRNETEPRWRTHGSFSVPSTPTFRRAPTEDGVKLSTK